MESVWQFIVSNPWRILGTIDDISSGFGYVAFFYSAFASYFLWRSRAREHKFTRVYFPKDRDDFYRYYVKQISSAKKRVCITSDGFHLRTEESMQAAQKMNRAQSKAISRGAEVIRYQMTERMHLKWLSEIVKMRERHGEAYVTVINPAFEDIGNMAVIDPDTRNAITEFMFADINMDESKAEAYDYGFVHGHQAKANKVNTLFEEILAHNQSQAVTADTLDTIRRALAERRLADACKNPDKPLFDEELINAAERCGGVKNVTYEDIHFN